MVLGKKLIIYSTQKVTYQKVSQKKYKKRLVQWPEKKISQQNELQNSQRQAFKESANIEEKQKIKDELVRLATQIKHTQDQIDLTEGEHGSNIEIENTVRELKLKTRHLSKKLEHKKNALSNALKLLKQPQREGESCFQIVSN